MRGFPSVPILQSLYDHRWHRIAEYQRVSLKMIAEGVLSGCPSIDLGTLGRGLFFDGEIECAKLRLNKPVTLVASANNPGASRMARELQATFNGIAVKSVADVVRTSSLMPASHRLLESISSHVGVSQRTGSSLLSSASKTQFFVLYLNTHTFLNEAGEQLADELRTIQQRNPRPTILLLHENDHALGGCEFGRWRLHLPLEAVSFV